MLSPYPTPRGTPLPDQISAETDRAALTDLYQDTRGVGWTGSQENWLSDAPLRQWAGVKTDSNGRVTELSLVNMRLAGELSSELGNLTELTVLNLSGNQVSGVIPVEFGNLTKLRELYLNNNVLSGELPIELTTLTGLTQLWLDGNALNGEIPSGVGKSDEVGPGELG